MITSEKLEELGRLPPKETHRVLMELSLSLAHSHKAGIVHRDIKPDNIMLEGFLGRVLLMDFGIAKELGDSNLTGSGVLMGTPTYMSPEQASGEGQVDQRSDIYSIGVLGYQMLTGRPPFEGISPAMVIAGHMAFEFTPLRQANPYAPKTLADAVERCLAKNPDDRFQSAMDLFDTLQRVRFYGIGDEQPARTEHRPLPVAGFMAGLCIASATLLALGAGRRPQLDSIVYTVATIAFGLATVATSRTMRSWLAALNWLPERL